MGRQSIDSWGRDFTAAMKIRGAPQAIITRELAAVRAECVATGEGPITLFGRPGAYAAELDLEATPAGPPPSVADAIPASLIGVALLFGWRAGMGALGGTSAVISLGDVLGLVVYFGAVLWLTFTVDRFAVHPIANIAVMALATVAVVGAALLLSSPSLAVPVVVAAGIAVWLSLIHI